MTEFGQTIPALPQIYSNQSTFQFTKAGMMHHLCRVFKTVGMVPVINLWPYDALNPLNAEISLPTNRTWLFFWDFPDTSTFTVSGQTWRPFAMLSMWTGAYTSSTSSNLNHDTLRVDVGIRLSGDFNPTESYTRYRHHGDIGNVEFGWGTWNTAFSSIDFNFNSTTGGFYSATEGMYIRKGDWKPFAAHVTAQTQELVTVRNIFCYLGPAGLFLYVGSQTNRTAFGNLIASGFAFAGGRLPGRALAAGDVNLPRINPILYFPLRDSATVTINNIWDGNRLRSVIHGIQHDQNDHLDMVMADIWNLENAEIPLTPDVRPFTLESPRELLSGQGAHILGRMIVVPRERRALDSEFVGPVRPSITTTSTRPEFFELFTAPRFRFGDKTAPLGDFQDPDTLDNWRIVPHPLFGTLALYSENAVVVSVTSVGTLTEQTPRSYSLTAVDQNTTTAFVSNVVVASSPAGTNANLIKNGTFPGLNNAVWKSPSATDLLIMDMLDFTSSNSQTRLNWTIDIPALEDTEFVYTFRFDARMREGTEGPQGVSPSGAAGEAFFQVIAIVNGVEQSSFFIYTAGTNMAHTSWDFTTYDAPVLRDGSLANSPISLQLVGHVGSAGDHNASPAPIIEVNSISLRAFKYI